MVEIGRDDALSAPVCHLGGVGAGPPDGNPDAARPHSIKLRRSSKSGYRCDWCGEDSTDIRRNGPRICRKCWANRPVQGPPKC
jgi:hypothetical protein